MSSDIVTNGNNTVPPGTNALLIDALTSHISPLLKSALRSTDVTPRKLSIVSTPQSLSNSISGLLSTTHLTILLIITFINTFLSNCFPYHSTQEKNVPCLLNPMILM